VEAKGNLREDYVGGKREISRHERGDPRSTWGISVLAGDEKSRKSTREEGRNRGKEAYGNTRIGETRGFLPVYEREQTVNG